MPTARSDLHHQHHRSSRQASVDDALLESDQTPYTTGASTDQSHQSDLLTQTWHDIVSSMSAWAHKPPQWFPDWLEGWLKSSSVPGFWLWTFAILATLLSIVCLVIGFKAISWIAGSVELRNAQNKRARKMMHSPYQARRILTANETEFFGRLRKALTPRYVLFSQVSMSALLEPKPLYTGREYMQLRAKFSQKYVDFIVCDPVTIEVIALIELDDITHDPEKDAKRDEMMEGAGYVTVRWHSRNKPSVQDIARTIDRLADRRAWMNTQPMS